MGNNDKGIVGTEQVLKFLANIIEEKLKEGYTYLRLAKKYNFTIVYLFRIMEGNLEIPLSIIVAMLAKEGYTMEVNF